MMDCLTLALVSRGVPGDQMLYEKPGRLFRMIDDAGAS
jgi:hypothetical protein